MKPEDRPEVVAYRTAVEDALKVLRETIAELESTIDPWSCADCGFTNPGGAQRCYGPKHKAAERRIRSGRMRRD